MNQSVIYIATAYRWGRTNSHQYIVYVGTDKAKAAAMAEAECSDRGGKYGIEVCLWAESDSGDPISNSVCYFPSSYGEKLPEHNYRIDMFETLGHKFARFAEGFETHIEPYETLKSSEGKPRMVVKEYPCDVPAWVKAEYDRQKEFYAIMEKFQAERRDATK